MGAAYTQLFPPKPEFTEQNIPSLEGKVFIITGGNSGIGFEIAKILYSRGGTVYIAGRSLAKIDAAIDTIKSAAQPKSGSLKSLLLDTSDLTTVSPCVSKFLAQESRLDVLFNNAGVSQAPAGSMSAQGKELHMSTNCLGHFLLTKLLLQTILKTAKSSPSASTRVIFTSSGIIETSAPPGGIALAELATGSKDKARNYATSKAGNWFLASEFDKRIRKDNVVCLTQNPGTLRTAGWDKAPLLKILCSPLMYEPKYGAYTGLWAGLSPEVTLGDGGRFGIPWGRWHPSPKKDIVESLKSVEEGGTGLAAKFWDWCEAETKDYI